MVTVQAIGSGNPHDVEPASGADTTVEACGRGSGAYAVIRPSAPADTASAGDSGSALPAPLRAGDQTARRAQLAQAVAALPALGAVDLTDPYGIHRLTAIWLESRRSAATSAAYHTDLSGWLAWCTERGLDPLGARRADVDLYAADLGARLAPASVARKLSAVSSWYRYLISNEACDRNPVDAADRPKPDRDGSATIGLSREEASRFLAAATTDERPLRLRTAALLGIMLTEGVRVSEICSADVADLGYNRGWRTLTVLRKGGKRQQLPLPPPIADVLHQYLTDRAARAGIALGDLDGPLFVTEPSGPHPGGRRLDRWAVAKLIRRIARRAAIPSWSQLTPHSLRHSFATLSLDAGVALRDVQDAMGHADPRTTRAYDRARYALDRHPATRLVSFVATPSSDR